MQRVRVRRHAENLPATIYARDLADVITQYHVAGKRRILTNVRGTGIEQSAGLFIASRRQQNLGLGIVGQQTVERVRSEQRGLAILATNTKGNARPLRRQPICRLHCQRLAHEVDLPRLQNERLISKLVNRLDQVSLAPPREVIDTAAVRIVRPLRLRLCGGARH